MNEVETAPAPKEKHEWIQPRVVKPTKPKTSPTISYMSELVSPASGAGEGS
jgi:hypothetical protein